MLDGALLDVRGGQTRIHLADDLAVIRFSGVVTTRSLEWAMAQIAYKCPAGECAGALVYMAGAVLAFNEECAIAQMMAGVFRESAKRPVVWVAAKGQLPQLDRMADRVAPSGIIRAAFACPSEASQWIGARRSAFRRQWNRLGK